MLKKTGRRIQSNASGSSSEPGSGSYESSFSSYSESFSVETDLRWWKAFEPVPRDDVFSEGSRSYEEEVSFETEYTGESEEQSQWDEELEIIDVAQARSIHAAKSKSNHSIHSSSDKSQKSVGNTSSKSHTSNASARKNVDANIETISQAGQQKSVHAEDTMEAMDSSDNVEIIKTNKVPEGATNAVSKMEPRPSHSNSKDDENDSDDGESVILFDEDPGATEFKNSDSLWNNYSLWDRSPTSHQISDAKTAPFSRFTKGVEHEPQVVKTSSMKSGNAEASQKIENASEASPKTESSNASGRKKSSTKDSMQSSQRESRDVESTGVQETKTFVANSSTSQSSKPTTKPRVKRLSKLIKSGISRRNPNNGRIPDELPMPPRNGDPEPTLSLVSPRRRIPSNLPKTGAKSQTSSKEEQHSTSSISSSVASLHTYSVSHGLASATAGSRSKTPVIQNYQKAEKSLAVHDQGNYKDASSVLTRFANSESTFSQQTVPNSETSSFTNDSSTKASQSSHNGKLQNIASTSVPVNSPSRMSPRKLWKLFKEKNTDEPSRPLRISGFDNSSGIEVERGFSPSKPPHPTYVQSVHTVTSLYDSEGQKVEGNSMYVITVEDQSGSQREVLTNSTPSEQTVSSFRSASHRATLYPSKSQLRSVRLPSELSVDESSTTLRHISTVMEQPSMKANEVDSHTTKTTDLPMTLINIVEKSSGASELRSEAVAEERDQTDSTRGSEDDAKSSVALHRTRNLSVIDGGNVIKVNTKEPRRVMSLGSEDELCVKSRALTLTKNRTGASDRPDSVDLDGKNDTAVASPAEAAPAVVEVATPEVATPEATSSEVAAPAAATSRKKEKKRRFRKKKSVKESTKEEENPMILLPFLDYNPFRMVFLAESEGRDEHQSQRDGAPADERQMPIEQGSALEDVQMSLSPLGVEMTDEMASSIGTDETKKLTKANRNGQQGSARTPTFLRVPLSPLKSTKGVSDPLNGEVLDKNKKVFQAGKVLRTPLFRRKDKMPVFQSQELPPKPDGKTPKRRFFKRQERADELNIEALRSPDVASVDVAPLVSYRRPNFEYTNEASPPRGINRLEIEDEQDLLSQTSLKTFLSSDTKLSDKLLDRLAKDMKLLEKIEKQRRLKGDESKSIATSMQLLKTVDELLKGAGAGAAPEVDESLAESDHTDEEHVPTMSKRISDSFMNLFSCHPCVAE